MMCRLVQVNVKIPSSVIDDHNKHESTVNNNNNNYRFLENA